MGRPSSVRINLHDRAARPYGRTAYFYAFPAQATSLRTTAASSLRGERWPLSSPVGKLGSARPFVDGVREERLPLVAGIGPQRIHGGTLSRVHLPAVASNSLREKKTARCRVEEGDLVPVDRDFTGREAAAALA